MHELSLCQSIYGVVERASEGRPVLGVDLEVGQLRQVVPETLAHCWRLVTEGTPLAGSVLTVDHVPVSLRCHGCAAVTTLEQGQLVVRCGACGSADTSVVAGEQLLVTAIEVEDDLVPSAADAGARQERW